MSPAERDWDKELAEIDKVIARSPGPTGLPPAPVSPQPTPGAKTVSAPPSGRRAILGTWLQVLLGAVLAVGMTQWPYAHDCGLRLFLYFGAAGLVVVAGIWGALSSWRRRIGLAHALALLVILAGVGLITSVVLPRAGYARHSSTWMCP